MYKLRQIVLLSFLYLSLTLSVISSAFCFGEFEDAEKNRISFRYLPDEDLSAETERKVFIASFDDNYSYLKPHDIKAHFKTRNDVEKWLDGVFTDEWDYFKKAKHPVKLVRIFKNEKVIGLAFVEQWGNEKETMHIRQMAVLPDEQRHGYGGALIDALKKQPDWPVNKMVADTRFLNKRGRGFFQKIGFKERKPFDPELEATGNYTGIEWVREDKKE